MLDAETKRRIDTARDILVGKVPDPKSQVEQITIALIYKFMDDMDAQSEALGGQRGFFAGAFAPYGWAKLMRGGLGGYEMIERYMNAIAKMPENPGIPQLFRNIFNNAFLPYRDPETLRAFLKVIDEFEYDHSERLGDAFEYLLSVLGSQGDAGQFRTPRHIIDFMVALLDPKKDETVLDPACGTAGFLISSYKHILAANADDRGQSTLSLDDKGRLAVNFRGYDISPDMVRLSLVNLYLHGFVAPQIREYDTLTSEERWADRADVILANPPFMSPKGGIRPHHRFSVKSKRSEVLFVDYIAEHLTPTGRAGIIIPEGVIFQSQNAHKQLRKMLIEDSLIAVVSLPAGVFQPYSGVKTSILILDKSLAKKTDRIAFFKVANDGFDLGAQRRPIAENDLPQVQAELAEYLHYLRTGESADAPQVAERGVQYTAKQGLVVKKDRIAEGGEYNLSGERYRENRKRTSEFPYVPLDEIAKIVAGNSAPQGAEYFENGKFPFIRTSDVGAVHRSANFFGTADKVNQKAVDELRLRLLPPGTILFPKSGASTFLNHRVLISEAAYVSSHLACIICDEQKGLPKYVYYLLCQLDARVITPDQAYPSLRLKELGNIEIPLPPLEVQREIVAEIEGYQRVIDGARAVVENYRPHIAIDPKWSMVEIGKVIKTVTPPAKIRARDFSTDGRYPVIDQSQNPVAGWTNDEKYLIDGSSGMVIFGDHTCAVKFTDDKFAQGADGIKILTVNKQLEPKFLYFFLLSYPIIPDGYKRHFRKLRETPIAIPPLAIQQAIVAEIEAEQALVDGNRELIERFEEKIRDAVGRVWGEGIG